MKKFLFLLISLNSCICFTQKSADTVLIENHLQFITKTDLSRNYKNVEVLDSVAEYIYNTFGKYCDTTFYQSYFINDIEYVNVIGRINTGVKEKIVLGAHYDVCGDQEGADDNASGIVGLLELARLLSADSSLNYQIEFVAFTLEEPPYFRTEMMGSAIHAKSLENEKSNIVGMVCLEMIGYFSEEKKSQNYPLGFLKLFYGGRGDFITVVEKFGPGKFARKFGKQMKKADLIETKIFKGPEKLQGIDFSGHLNYWALGISAVMITDTAFYRNKNYHRDGDTMEKLDLPKMAMTINEVYKVISGMH